MQWLGKYERLINVRNVGESKMTLTPQQIARRELPPHLKKLVDTPAKRKRLNAILKKGRDEQLRSMRKKGFKLVGNKFIKMRK